MTRRPWRRTLVSRLLSPRIPRRLPRSTGICPACGVTFVASVDRYDETEEIFRVHRSICPGGDHSGDVVTPFA